MVRTLFTNEHSFLFLDVDPSKSMNLEASAKEHIKDLQRHIKANILADVGGKVSKHPSWRISYRAHTILQLSISGFVGTLQSLFSAKARKQKLSVAESLFENGATVDRTTNNVLSLLVGATVELSQCEIVISSTVRWRLSGHRSDYKRCGFLH